jgi:hypothetical protein
LFVARVALALLAVAAVGSLLLARDSRPVSASHTEMFLSLSATTSTAVPLTPWYATPGEAPRTIYAHARNVTHDPTGVAAFQVNIVYDSDVVTISSLQVSETWLESTGRTATCTTPIIEPNPGSPPDIYRANIGCYTAGATPPFGAMGGGLLASFVATPGSTPSSTSFNVNNTGTFLLNATQDATQIATIKRNASIIVAACADFNGDNAVSAGDIAKTVAKFGTHGPPNQSAGWEAIYDLNIDNVISAADVGIVVAQYGRVCPT